MNFSWSVYISISGCNGNIRSEIRHLLTSIWKNSKINLLFSNKTQYSENKSQGHWIFLDSWPVTTRVLRGTKVQFYIKFTLYLKRGRNFSSVSSNQTGSDAHPASYAMGNRRIRWITMTPHLHLITTLRIHGATPLLLHVIFKILYPNKHRNKFVFTFTDWVAAIHTAYVFPWNIFYSNNCL